MLPKGGNRIPLTGLLHTFLSLLLAVAPVAPASAPARPGPMFAEDVPFIATPERVTETMLDLAGVKAGDHLIDLGSGDGRIVIAAARRGATGLGVENDPGLVAESIAHAKRAGVGARARFLEQDLFRTDLAAATVVTMYLLPEVNLQLRPAILALRPGTRIVSHDWDMGEWQPDRTVSLEVPEKTTGFSKSSRVHLWIVPARVEGLWCGVGAKRRALLRLRQSFQHLSGEITIDGGPRAAISGRIAGSAIELEQAGSDGRWRMTTDGGTLRSREALGTLQRARDFAWRAAGQGGGCGERG